MGFLWKWINIVEAVIPEMITFHIRIFCFNEKEMAKVWSIWHFLVDIAHGSNYILALTQSWSRNSLTIKMNNSLAIVYSRCMCRIFNFNYAFTDSVTSKFTRANSYGFLIDTREANHVTGPIQERKHGTNLHFANLIGIELSFLTFDWPFDMRVVSMLPIR